MLKFCMALCVHLQKMQSWMHLVLGLNFGKLITRFLQGEKRSKCISYHYYHWRMKGRSLAHKMLYHDTSSQMARDGFCTWSSKLLSYGWNPEAHYRWFTILIYRLDLSQSWQSCWTSMFSTERTRWTKFWANYKCCKFNVTSQIPDDLLQGDWD